MINFILLILTLPFISSISDGDSLNPNPAPEAQVLREENDILRLPKGINSCTYVSSKLMAGQNQEVGEVTVIVDRVGYFKVTYSITEPGYCLQETHLSVVRQYADFPVTQAGNPSIGNFEYSGNHDCSVSVSYTIPMEKGYLIAAHAVVKGQSKSSETAWAKGCDFTGDSWAMYFQAANLIPG
ncbi:hypothetical protein [Zeaxanthinibacter enoshimensis]|uniref:hypothetical protein n=1 Tax=Zeaxanthinibacter enoshimensis TaxID=392009 RepID=UPI003565435D